MCSFLVTYFIVHFILRVNNGTIKHGSVQSIGPGRRSMLIVLNAVDKCFNMCKPPDP